MPRQHRQPQLSLLDLDDACLSLIVSKLGLTRRTVMTVCKRLKGLAEASLHTRQQAGQSVMDVIELAQPGDTVHLLPQRFKEALLLRKPLHLTCDGGRASILSPARFAVMVAASGCLLENLVLKSHQIDEDRFYLVEQGPTCRHVQLRSCEVLQGSFVGINSTASDATRMLLERCLLHVGLSAMKGRLEVVDTCVKCSGDALFTTADATLVLRRCSFVDIAEALQVESRTAVIEHCDIAAYDRGPVIVTCGRIGGEVEPGDHEDINSKLLYLEDALPDLPVYMCEYLDAKATGTRATEEQHAAVEAGGVVEGHVVLWANTAFESRSNDNITAQQEEVRREARELMLQMQRAQAVAEAAEWGLHEEDVSIGNSVENPEEDDMHDFDDEDDGWDDAGFGQDGDWDSLSEDDEDWDSEGDDSDSQGPGGLPPGEPGGVIDLVSDDSLTTSSSGSEGSGGSGGSGARRRRGGSEEDEDSSSGGSSRG